MTLVYTDYWINTVFAYIHGYKNTTPSFWSNGCSPTDRIVGGVSPLYTCLWIWCKGLCFSYLHGTNYCCFEYCVDCWETIVVYSLYSSAYCVLSLSTAAELFLYSTLKCFELLLLFPNQYNRICTTCAVLFIDDNKCPMNSRDHYRMAMLHWFEPFSLAFMIAKLWHSSDQVIATDVS